VDYYGRGKDCPQINLVLENQMTGITRQNSHATKGRTKTKTL